VAGGHERRAGQARLLPKRCVSNLARCGLNVARGYQNRGTAEFHSEPGADCSTSVGIAGAARAQAVVDVQGHHSLQLAGLSKLGKRPEERGRIGPPGKGDEYDVTHPKKGPSPASLQNQRSK
jgi:hypothetical protein